MTLLEAIVADRSLLLDVPEATRHRLLNAAGKVFAPDAAARRKMVREVARRRKAEAVEREEGVLRQTGIRALRAASRCSPRRTSSRREDFDRTTCDDPAFREDAEPQHCYVCKQRYIGVHHFYDQLCPTCGDFNFAKRTETADLRGRVALLTGGRVKIGYQAGIKLLRAGRRR